MMIGRRATVGLTLLCALLFSAAAAQSAMAVEGTTAFTCESTNFFAQFKDAHCTEGKKLGSGFQHIEIKENEVTKTHASNAKTDATTTGSTPTVLRATALGVENEIVCSKVLGHGDLSNIKDATTKEHTIRIEKLTTHKTDCKVNKPAGCVIPNGTTLIEALRAESKGQPFPNIKFEPEVGTTIATITYEKCTNGLLNGAHNLEGTFKGQFNGATIEFTHNTVTAEKTLTFFGAAAGISGKYTISQATKTTSAGDAESGNTGNPISVTRFST